MQYSTGLLQNFVLGRKTCNRGSRFLASWKGFYCDICGTVPTKTGFVNVQHEQQKWATMIRIQGLRMAFAGTHAPGRAGQHFDLFDSIFDRV